MKSKLYLLAFVVPFFVSIGNVYAVNSLEKDETQSIDNANIGMAQAVTTAKQYVGGRAVHAEYEHHKDQSTFDVEVVKDKMIMKVNVDTTSGKVLSPVEDKDDEHKKLDKHHKAIKDNKVI